MRYANFMAARVPERCRSKFSKNMTLINFLPVIHGCATFKEHSLFSDQLYEIVSEDSGPKIVEMSIGSDKSYVRCKRIEKLSNKVP